MAAPAPVDLLDTVDIVVNLEREESLSPVNTHAPLATSADSPISSSTSTPASTTTTGSRRSSRRPSVAPVLPLSVSTRSMAKLESAPTSLAASITRLPTTSFSVRKSGIKGKKGSGTKLAVLDENQQTGLAVAKPIALGKGVERKTLRGVPPSNSIATQSAATGKLPSAKEDQAKHREPLSMMQSKIDNFFSVKPAEGSAGKPAPVTSAPSKAAASKNAKRKVAQSPTVADKSAEAGRAKRVKVDRISESDISNLDARSIAMSAMETSAGRRVGTQDVEGEKDEEEEDEPMPTRFASLRHRPPTPPRLWSIRDRRKSAGVPIMRDEHKEDDVEMVSPARRSVPGADEHAAAISAGSHHEQLPLPSTPDRALPSPTEDVSMSPVFTPKPPTPISTTHSLAPAAHSSIANKLATTPLRIDTEFAGDVSPVQVFQSPRRGIGPMSRFGTPRKMAPLPRSKLSANLSAPDPQGKSTKDLLSATITVGAETAEAVGQKQVAQTAIPDGLEQDLTTQPRTDDPQSSVGPSKPSLQAPLPTRARNVSGSTAGYTSSMAPPSLPTRSLRSSASVRALPGTGDTGPPAVNSTKETYRTRNTSSKPSASTLPRSSTLFASTISSAAKTSLPPLTSSNMGNGPGSKKAPLGEVRRPGQLLATAATEVKALPTASNTRKPSYPSSLSIGTGQPGSTAGPSTSSVPRGPLGRIGRPRDRTVSVPVPASVLDSFRSDGPYVDDVDGGLSPPDGKGAGVNVVSSLSPIRRSPPGGGLSPGMGLPIASAGSGSPSRRTVSAPVRSSLHAIDVEDSGNAGTQSGPLASSTSATSRAPRESLGLSMSARRDGASWGDTSKSFVGLAAALERLKRKDSMVGKGVRASLGVGSGSNEMAVSTSSDDTAGAEQGIRQEQNVHGDVSERLAAVHRPRHSIAVAPTATESGIPKQGTIASTSRLLPAFKQTSSQPTTTPPASTTAAGADAAERMKALQASRCLKGVVAHVDVWTADGTDSSAIFEEMLRSMGARVLTRPTDSVTHLIYKSGRPSTLTWYRKAAAAAIAAAEDAEYKARLAGEQREMGIMVDGTGVQEGVEGKEQKHAGPSIVGLSWVTKCKAEGKRLNESKFAVDVKEEDVFSKRRKSMEPKTFQLAERLATTPSGRAPLSAMSQIAEARRKSMLYAPKVGSPLKRAFDNTSRRS